MAFCTATREYNSPENALIVDHFIKKLRFARRPTPQTQPQTRQGDDFASGRKRHHVADSHRRTGLFDAMSVQPDLSLDRFLLCQAAGLAEARMPEPFVDAKRIAQISIRCDEPGKSGKRRVRLDGLRARPVSAVMFCRPHLLPHRLGLRFGTDLAFPA